MTLRTLTPDDAAAFFALRLEGLRLEPKAFGASAEDFAQLPLSALEERLQASPQKFTLGAFEEGQLLGLTGLIRKGGKMRHQADIWGVYVTPSARGRGLAKALMQETIARARQMPELKQLELAVAVSQTSAQALYDALGFEVWGYQKSALWVGDEFVDEEHRVLWL